jgi:hypothetical protein
VHPLRAHARQTSLPSVPLALNPGVGLLVCPLAFFFFLVVELGFELRASHFLGKLSLEARPLLALVIFHVGSRFYVQADLDHKPPVAEVTGTLHHTQLFY